MNAIFSLSQQAETSSPSIEKKPKIKRRQVGAASRGPARPVQVFPDIYSKLEGCLKWARKVYARSLLPSDFEDVVQEALKRIFENHCIWQELEQAARLPAVSEALRTIRRSGGLTKALRIILKVPGTLEALVELLNHCDNHSTVQKLLCNPRDCEDASVIQVLGPDLLELLNCDSQRCALLTILRRRQRHPAVLMILLRHPVQRVIAGILRTWPNFDKTDKSSLINSKPKLKLKSKLKSKPVPFEVAFKRTLRGCWVDFLRKKYRSPQIEEIDEQAPDLEAKDAAHRKSDQSEMNQQLLKCVDALTERERLVLSLTFSEGLSDEEISPILAMPTVSVRVMRHRAVKKIRKCFFEGGVCGCP